jgi:RNA polymerase sigma-70 factor, ECF subfamily
MDATVEAAVERAQSDAALVADLAEGSESAMAALYDRHAGMVYRVALSLNPDPGAAEETVQETFLALWNKAEQFDANRGSLGGWLATIARNRAIDRFRSAGRHAQATPFASVRRDDHDESFDDWLVSSATVLAAGSPEQGPDAAFAEKDSRATIEAALERLTDLERLAIVLAYRDGLSQSEIAAELGWPLGTVKTRSRRALHRLREVLEDREQAPLSSVDRPALAAPPAPVVPTRPTPCHALPC